MQDRAWAKMLGVDRRVKLGRNKLEWIQSAVLIGMVGALSGCPDVEGKYDRFLDATADEREEYQNMDPGQSGGFANIEGDFILALSSSVAPSLPLQFIATVTFEALDDGTGTLDLDLQPLSLTPQSTNEPRLPVGEVLEYRDVEVNEDGTFAIDLGEVTVVGEANPISGSEIIATLNLEASTLSEDLWCGSVTGMIFAPLTFDLQGSTFASVRLERSEPEFLPGADGQPALQLACPGSDGEEESGSGG